MMELREDQETEIRELLMGRKVIKVSNDTLSLDDGTTLVIEGNDGCGFESHLPLHINIIEKE